MNRTRCRVFPFKQLCSKSKIVKNGCVSIFIIVLFSFQVRARLAVAWLVYTSKLAESVKITTGVFVKIFPGEGKRHHITNIFQVADVAMQMDVHKTLYCFYTKKLHHESTHSICIYFEIFFKWSCTRVCHKSGLSAMRYSVC